MRVLADDAISLNDDLFAGLITDDPFPTANRYCLRRLIVDRDKVNEWVRPVRWCFKCRHEDNLVDCYSNISQFPKRAAHLTNIYGFGPVRMESLSRWKRP